MRIHYLQHVSFENPGMIVEWAKKNKLKLTGTHLYNYEELPTMERFDCLIIMGGPMNIYEEEKYPWLKYEKKFIKEAINNDKIILGICLGAQLITDVLGGKVTKNQESEIGWLPVDFNEKILESPIFKYFPKRCNVFQWHNDTFSTLGKGAIGIASSDGCNQQAFVYKEKIIGFQFHIECTKESISSLIKNCEDDMTEGIYVQNAEQIESKMNFLETANDLMEKLLNNIEAYYLKKE